MRSRYSLRGKMRKNDVTESDGLRAVRAKLGAVLAEESRVAKTRDRSVHSIGYCDGRRSGICDALMVVDCAISERRK